MQTDKYTKVMLTLIAIGIFLNAPSIYAGPVKEATIVGTLAGIGTSMLIVGLEKSLVIVTDKKDITQVITIGVATGIFVGTLSWFYLDGKSENHHPHSMISNKEFQKAWKRATTLHQLRIQPSYKGLTGNAHVKWSQNARAKWSHFKCHITHGFLPL